MELRKYDWPGKGRDSCGAWSRVATRNNVLPGNRGGCGVRLQQGGKGIISERCGCGVWGWVATRGNGLVARVVVELGAVNGLLLWLWRLVTGLVVGLGAGLIGGVVIEICDRVVVELGAVDCLVGWLWRLLTGLVVGLGAGLIGGVVMEIGNRAG